MNSIIKFFARLFGQSVDKIDESLIQKFLNNPDDDQLLKAVSQHLESVAQKALNKLDADIKIRKRLKPHGTHKRWENQIANQIVEPLQYCKPNSLNEIYNILQLAIKSGLKVKAAGSGHSYSDVATTPDLFIDTHGLNRIGSEEKPIAGQLKQGDLKTSWQTENMKSKWRSMEGTPEIDVDSSMEDIMKVRDIAQNNVLLFETEAGITVKDLNNALCDKGLGLPNMGGYDGQTIVGVISTSTHGSGIGLGPFPDIVKSLILATTGSWNGNIISGQSNGPVNYYRIELSDGVTDPVAYKANQATYQLNGNDIQLIQDDDCFYSVITNMGTMGVIYSVVIEVMQLYYLTETRVKSTLDETFKLLEPDPNDPQGIPQIMRRYRNFEILINPYPMNGNKVIEMDLTKPPEDYYPFFETLLTKRNITHPPEKEDDRDDGDKPRNPFTAIIGKLDISFKALAALLNLIPSIAPKIIKSAINALPDQNFVRKSFKIYNLGIDGDAGFANEIGFSLQDQDQKYTMDHFKAAVDSIHKVAQLARIEGQQYQTSPFSLRFVKRSSAYLSMMNERNTCMIEIDMVTGSYAGEEILNRQQDALYQLGGRPHWGLEFDQLNGNHKLITKMYPNFPKWKKVYDQLNSKGTFDNKTTNRLGFSELDYVE